MLNYEERLKKILKERKEENICIDDVTILYNDFIHLPKRNINMSRYYYLWDKVKESTFKPQYIKRVVKEDFNRYLFSKIIFNWLYNVKNSSFTIYKGENENNDYYKMRVSGQYIKRELNTLSIDDIMFLAWELAKTFKHRKAVK